MKMTILMLAGITLGLALGLAGGDAAPRTAEAAMKTGATSSSGAGTCQVCSIDWGSQSSSCQAWLYDGGEYCIALPGIECITWESCKGNAPSRIGLLSPQ